MEPKGTGQCPKCGSWDVWVSMDKPPSYVCKKCGHSYSKTRVEKEQKSEDN